MRESSPKQPTEKSLDLFLSCNTLAGAFRELRHILEDIGLRWYIGGEKREHWELMRKIIQLEDIEDQPLCMYDGIKWASSIARHLFADRRSGLDACLAFICNAAPHNPSQRLQGALKDLRHTFPPHREPWPTIHKESETRAPSSEPGIGPSSTPHFSIIKEGRRAGLTMDTVERDSIKMAVITTRYIKKIEEITERLDNSQLLGLWMEFLQVNLGHTSTPHQYQQLVKLSKLRENLYQLRQCVSIVTALIGVPITRRECLRYIRTLEVENAYLVFILQHVVSTKYTPETGLRTTEQSIYNRLRSTSATASLNYTNFSRSSLK